MNSPSLLPFSVTGSNFFYAPEGLGSRSGKDLLVSVPKYVLFVFDCSFVLDPV